MENYVTAWRRRAQLLSRASDGWGTGAGTDLSPVYSKARENKVWEIFKVTIFAICSTVLAVGSFLVSSHRIKFKSSLGLRSGLFPLRSHLSLLCTQRPILLTLSPLCWLRPFLLLCLLPGATPLFWCPRPHPSTLPPKPPLLPSFWLLTLLPIAPHCHILRTSMIQFAT